MFLQIVLLMLFIGSFVQISINGDTLEYVSVNFNSLTEQNRTLNATGYIPPNFGNLTWSRAARYVNTSSLNSTSTTWLGQIVGYVAGDDDRHMSFVVRNQTNEKWQLTSFQAQAVYRSDLQLTVVCFYSDGNTYSNVKRLSIQNPILISPCSNNNIISVTLFAQGDIRLNNTNQSRTDFLINNLAFSVTNVVQPPCLPNEIISPTTGNCTDRNQILFVALSILNSNLTSVTQGELANNLQNYYAALNNSPTTNTPLSPNRIDSVVELFNTTLIRNTPELYLISAPPLVGDDRLIGAGFSSIYQGVNISQKFDITQVASNTATLQAAVVINDNDFLVKGNYLKMLLISKPTNYPEKYMNRTLISSVIVVDGIHTRPINNLTLYFSASQEGSNYRYVCVSWNSTNWSDVNCTYIGKNPQVQNLHECHCSHTTTFALMFQRYEEIIPPTVNSTTANKTTRSDYNAVDYISIVIQFVAIFCFLYIIVHSLITKYMHPADIRYQEMMPLFSAISGCLFFIFHLSLQFYVYFTTIDSSTVTCSHTGKVINKCDITSQALMYVVYFIIIFNFAFKASIGYFNYQRLVRSVEQPLLEWSLFRALLTFSSGVACLFLILLIGSNYAYLPFIRLLPYRICWLVPEILYFYLTIPVALSALISGSLLIRFCYIGFLHRIKQGAHSWLLPRVCLIIFSSCITQSVPWLLGQLVAVSDTFTWVFIVSNALEGIWSLLLYRLILRPKRSNKSNISDRNVVSEAQMHNSSQVQRRRQYVDVSTLPWSPIETKSKAMHENIITKNVDFNAETLV